MIERARVDPDTSGTHVPGACGRSTEQFATQAPTDEVRHQAEVRELQVVVGLTLELEITGGGAGDVHDPRFELGTIEIGEPPTVVPWEPAVPGPAGADGRIQKSISARGAG